MTSPCKIIGILDNGLEGLSQSALRDIQSADLVIGGARTLTMVESETKAHCEMRDLAGNIPKIPDWIRVAQNQGERVVVLATGDPLCHGIANFLGKKLDKDALQIIPNVSTIQIACARLGLPLQQVQIVSAHSKDMGDWHGEILHKSRHGLYPVLQAIQKGVDLAVFTSPENSPARIARMLRDEGYGDDYQISVAENLMRESERLHEKLQVSDAVNQKFSEPNILILHHLKNSAPTPLFGLADGEYKQRKPDKGLITKREVRAVSLARMQLQSDSLVWDIGAGSGSIGLEAASLCTSGFVYAMEKNEDDVAIIQQNRKALRRSNYSVVHGKAPAGLDDWPDPDAVFIGGSGGELDELIRLGLDRLRNNGWLVMNFVTFENLNTALETLKSVEADWDVTQLQVARSKPILDMNRLTSENPVWIVSARRSSNA